MPRYKLSPEERAAEKERKENLRNIMKVNWGRQTNVVRLRNSLEICTNHTLNNC